MIPLNGSFVVISRSYHEEIIFSEIVRPITLLEGLTHWTEEGALHTLPGLKAKRAGDT